MLSLVTTLPAWLSTLLIAAMPVLEIRGALPIALEVFGMPFWQAFALGVAGNMFSAVVLVFVLKAVAEFVSRHSSYGARFFHWWFAHTKAKFSSFAEASTDAKALVDRSEDSSSFAKATEDSSSFAKATEDSSSFAKATEDRQKSYDLYGAFALFLFVAIPLPMTGVWTASVAAILFGIRPKAALPAMLLGVIASGLVVGLVIGAVKFVA